MCCVRKVMDDAFPVPRKPRCWPLLAWHPCTTPDPEAFEKANTKHSTTRLLSPLSTTKNAVRPSVQPLVWLVLTS